jgi:thioredoxin-dependent peroxiredoxin
MPATAPTLPIGAKVPNFTLSDAQGRKVSLASLLGGPLVLYTYPEAGTPSCTKQACQFSEAMPAFAKLGKAKVVGISPDQPAKLAAFAAKHGLEITLLGDPAGADGVPATIAALGCWGEKSMYGKSYMGVIRTTYLVDAKGVITHAWANVRVPDHDQAVLEALGGATPDKAVADKPAKPPAAKGAKQASGKPAAKPAGKPPAKAAAKSSAKASKPPARKVTKKATAKR